MFFNTFNNAGHGVRKFRRKVGGGTTENFSRTRTHGIGRENDKYYQGTSNSNNQHITLLLPTIPYHHSPDLF